MVNERSSKAPNPIGNERLTAGAGIVLLLLTLAELVSVVFGVHRFMSLHVFVGFVLIPAVLLKLASTGWRFARYYTGAHAYVLQGPPRLAMRLLSPVFVAATVVLFASGVAMGVLHGRALNVARQLHGPASVIWIALVGIHVLVYLKRALISSSEDLSRASRASAGGATMRAYLIAAAVVSGLMLGIATVPAQHRWVNLRHDHHRERNGAGRSDGVINSSRKAGSEALSRIAQVTASETFYVLATGVRGEVPPVSVAAGGSSPPMSSRNGG
jgi:hypothetical protein